MATITCLNIDTISIILGNENISIEDVFNFTSTCKSLYDIVHEDNMLWKNKIIQRWPFLKKVYDTFDGHVNFKDQVKSAMKCRNKLRNYLSHLSEKHCYRIEELLDDDLNLLYESEKDEHYMNVYFFNAELINLLTLSSEKSDVDLTQKYYAKQVLLRMQHYLLKRNWRTFFSSCKEHAVEEAAIVITKWLQPEKFMSVSNIKISFDNITEKILLHALKKYPKHPRTPIEQFSSSDIDNNRWSAETGKQITRRIKEIFYQSYSLKELFPNLMAFLVHRVLRFEHDDTSCIAIIFQSVARRLSMHCEEYFGHINNFYIVVKPNCFQIESLGNLKIQEEVLYNGNLEWRFTNFKERNMKILKACAFLCQKPIQRTKKIKFSVGQVVKFINMRGQRSEVGVIIGWMDPLDLRFNLRLKTWAEYCDVLYHYGIPFHTLDWQIPFYTILCDNYYRKYIIEEEIIEIIPPGEFNHVEIGRYFCRLEKNHYVPNQMLAKHYPYDLTVFPKNTSPARNDSSNRRQIDVEITEITSYRNNARNLILILTLILLYLCCIYFLKE